MRFLKLFSLKPSLFGLTALFLTLAFMLQAQSDKPNILVIWGDDIGRSNISAYTMGR